MQQAVQPRARRAAGKSSRPWQLLQGQIHPRGCRCWWNDRAAARWIASSGRCSTTGRPRMRLELTRWLQQLDGLFGLFGYLTFRGILSALTALALSLWWGPAVIQIGRAHV